MKRYYGFSLNELYNLSLYQWNSYMDEIPKTMEYLSGGDSKQKDTTTTEDLMRMAKKKGIKTPTKFLRR